MRMDDAGGVKQSLHTMIVLPPCHARRQRFEQVCQRLRGNDPTTTNVFTTHLPVPCDNQSLTKLSRALVFNTVLSDLTIGIDEVIADDKGMQLLSDWLRDSTSLNALTMEVVFPNRNVAEQIQVARLLSQCMIGNPRIRELCLRQVDMSGFVEELNHLLSTSGSLTKLILAKCECEEGLSIDLFTTGLHKNTSLEHVDIFMPKQIVLDACLVALRGHRQIRVLSLSHTIFSTLEAFLKGTQGLRELVIKDCSPQPLLRMAQALEQHSGLERLVISNCGIDQQDARHLARMLRYNDVLKEIDLSRNHIGNTSIALIIDSMRENRTLRKLNLGRNLITFTRGDRVFHEMFGNDVQYTHLDISRNDLRGSMRAIPEGIRWVSTSLGRNSVLVELNLFKCRLGDDGTTRIADSLKQNSTLKVLNIGDNHVGVVGAQALVDMLRVNDYVSTLRMDANPIREGGLLMAEFLRQPESSSLKELHMKASGLKDETLVAMASALEVNSSLAVLKIDCNHFGDEAVAVLIHSLPRIVGLARLVLPCNEKTDLVQATMYRNRFVLLLQTDPSPSLWPDAFAWAAAVSKRGTTGLTAIYHVFSQKADSLLSPQKQVHSP